MSIGHRTIKLVLATVLAIWISDSLGLTYTTSAGIIGILSVLDTRKSSFKIAGQRFLSALLALAISCSLFAFLGYNLWVVGLYMAIYVPLAYYYELQVGIPPITVLVLHLYLEKSISPAWLVNELGLFLVGAGVALLLNLYMPSRQEEIADFHERVENQLKEILYKFQCFLTKGDGTNDAVLIRELDDILVEALHLVYQDSDNHLIHKTNYHIHYFEMRQNQNAILKEMATSVAKLDVKSEESLLLAQLFERTGQQLSQENPADHLLEDIETMLATYRRRPLPQTREEFEYRALLFELLGDLERFIKLKVSFYQNYHESEE